MTEFSHTTADTVRAVTGDPPEPRHPAGAKAKRGLRQALLAIPLIGLVVWTLAPFLVTLSVSFKNRAEVFEATVRYRTVGDMTCTGAVASESKTLAAVIAETAAARITERGATRADDTFSETAMEDRKREGYF